MGYYSFFSLSQAFKNESCDSRFKAMLLHSSSALLLTLGLTCLVSNSAFLLSNPALQVRTHATHKSCSATAGLARSSRSILSTARMAARDLPSNELRSQLIGAKKAIAELLDKTNAMPIMVCPILFLFVEFFFVDRRRKRMPNIMVFFLSGAPRMA